MEKTFIAVRDIDAETFRKFKAKMIERRMKLGDALTKAMKNYMEQKEKHKPNIKNFLSIKPISIGKKVKWSQDIDKILYT